MLFPSMTSFRPVAVLKSFAWSAVLVVGFESHSAFAQVIDQLFPANVQSLGGSENENVLARPRSDYTPLGVRFGDLTINPLVSEGFGYDSNVNGLKSGPGSALLNTHASLNVAPDWARDSLALLLDVNNHHYISEDNQDRTDWTASVLGSYQIADDTLSGAYTHLNLNETAQDVGAVLTQTPIPFSIDDIRLDYAISNRGRLAFTPELDYTAYRFSSNVVDGINQDYRNRDVVQGGVTARYELSSLRDLVLVVRGTHISYTGAVAGIPGRNSDGGAVLVGIDYSAAGVFRYRALVGYQVRQYESAEYSNIAEPIVEASVTWTPSLLTTVMASARRDIEDAADSTIGGFTYTTGRVSVDHEYKRNILLNLHGQVQRVEDASQINNLPRFLQSGGSETLYNAGVGATFLLNRVLRVSATFDYNTQHANIDTASFNESVGLITVTLQL